MAFLNRSDSILLYVGPLTYLAWFAHGPRIACGSRCTLQSRSHLLRRGCCSRTSITDFHFPIPITRRSRPGFHGALQLRQGLAYVANSINFDPLTLGLIGLTAVVAFQRRRLPEIAAAASALVYVLYTISVGGDFMSGRFFAMPLLLCAVSSCASSQRREVGAALGAALVAYNVFAPLAPVKTRANYPDGAWAWRLQNGIKDERGHYHQITNVLFYAPFRALPDHLWYREGISFRNSAEKVSVQGSIGFFGFNAGPTKYVIDRNALSDPLLARLPVSESLYFEFYAGHFFRDLPNGYVESRRERRNLLVDPLLHDYYDKLLNVTAGPLFSWARARDIWELNFGRYRRIHELVTAQRPVAVSVAADNERFSTDVGVRNTRGERHSDRLGRARGLPADGPEHPSEGRRVSRSAGLARHRPEQANRWVMVEAWTDGERLIARRAVFHGEFSAGDKTLAELTFGSKSRRPISSTASSFKKA